MMLASRLGLLGAALAALLGPTPAEAGSPTDDLRARIDHVLRIAGDSTVPSADRRASVRAVTADLFDVAETARRALGPHWLEASPTQQREFVALFTGVIESGALMYVDRYDGEAVEIVGERLQGDQAVVAARVVIEGGAIPVDFRMLRRPGHPWRLYDVAVGGVGLVANYRAQFTKILRASSWDGLLARLRAHQPASP